MGRDIEVALEEVLRERESAGVLSVAWMQDNYPLDWEELTAILDIDDILGGARIPVERLGPYRLLREVGRGGMGTVFLAEVVGRAPGLEIGDEVAVKIVHEHLLDTEESFGRLLREARFGMALQHPNVVRTLDVRGIRTEGRYYHFLVMTYERGRTLRQAVDEDGAAAESECRRVGVEIARGLGAIHGLRVVHRDLKPENVIVTEDGAVKVMDLGVVLDIDEAFRLTRTGAFVGSEGYAAPEQLSRTRCAVDSRTDLYSLGATLYEFATGTYPFCAARGPDNDSGPDVAPRRADEVATALSSHFADVLDRLLSTDPRDRFPCAEEVITALR